MNNDKQTNMNDAQHVTTFIKNALVLILPDAKFALVLGDAARTIHKVWPNGERKSEARAFVTPIDAKNAMWIAATRGEYR